MNSTPKHKAENLSFLVTDEVGMRLDVFLSDKLKQKGVSRADVQRLITEDNVKINGISKKKNYSVAAGDRISVFLNLKKASETLPENIPLDIVFEDEHIIVLNKSKGMVVHPAPGNYTGTLVSALMYHTDSLSDIGNNDRPGIVHRLDKDTSGLMVVAKSNKAYTDLIRQFSNHEVKRIYHAVVEGLLSLDEGVISTPIGRDPNDRIKFKSGVDNSKKAVTEYKVVEYLKGHTHIEVRLQTGRTHQIRVHMASIGHVVYGDKLYGPRKKSKSIISGQCLHSKELCFYHPFTKEYMRFNSKLPDYFIEVLKYFGKMEE
ncbi:MAG: RluA family pseudouridine synthase [Ruminococcaceae bacterium]|nr:RluA family pseudouridine synthase [Oscillospiraceae bacterium]